MGSLLGLSEAQRKEAMELQTQIESGAICQYCYLAECPREVKERPIFMGPKRAYPATCCAEKARQLQEAENVRQQGIRSDVVAGLERLAGIPARFKEADFSNFKMNLQNGEAVAAALDLVNHFAEREKTGRGLVLVGPAGVGKTHLGVAVMRRLVSNGIPSRYAYAPDFLELTRRRPSEMSELGYQTLRAFCTERCLFLDDAGIDRDTEFTVAQYTKLIDCRYREKHPLILATNLGLEDLEGVIGERSMGRLVESNEIIQVAGPDSRLS